MKNIVVGLGLLAISASQASFAVNRQDVNQSINISYGVVESVQKKKVDSNALGGAALGGIVGAATSGHHHRGKNAAVGALAGGLLTAIMEGKRAAWAYRIQMVDGGEKQIITEQEDAREGDCVSVEEGRLANIRRVASVHCEHHQHVAMQDYMVRSKAHESAAECHVAKEGALKADTEEEMDIALKKVRVFCD